MIPTKGELGRGHRERRSPHAGVMGDIRRLGLLLEEELFTAAKGVGAPFELVKWVADHGRLPVVVFTAGRIAPSADAALCLRLGTDCVFVGSGIHKSAEPSVRADPIAEATAPFRDPEILACASTGLGEPIRGIAELLQTRRLTCQ